MSIGLEPCGRTEGVRRSLLILKSADSDTVPMATFGTIIADARKAAGISQRELAARIKKEDGTSISAQYLNDVEHDRRNPPSEFLIGQLATILKLSKDRLCAAAGTLPEDLKKLATTQPDKFELAFKAFRKNVK